MPQLLVGTGEQTSQMQPEMHVTDFMTVPWDTHLPTCDSFYMILGIQMVAVLTNLWQNITYCINQGTCEERANFFPWSLLLLLRYLLYTADSDMTMLQKTRAMRSKCFLCTDTVQQSGKSSKLGPDRPRESQPQPFVAVWSRTNSLASFCLHFLINETRIMKVPVV